MLLALGAAYYLTYEPAPEVAVRWREGTTWQRRAELERRFGLVRARDIDDWKVWYDLVDIRPANIRSLAEEPDVAATQGLDLETYSIPPDGPYGKGWMWIGPRLPVLRHRGVVAGVILVCALTLALTLLTPPGDSTALAGAIRRMMDEPALAARLAAQGRTHVMERFSWDTITGTLADVYQRAVQR